MPNWKKLVTSGSKAVLAEVTASVGFKGDGSGLTNLPAQTGTITALNNQTANRLVTIGATTTELDGEANLTFDGSNGLDVSAGDITIAEGQKLYLDGGGNTYISSTAGDTLKMITGGSDRVTIDSGGRVGISTAPSELLHIKSSANSATPVILLENTNAGTFAPQINMYNNSSSPADDDYVGQVDFEGKDSAGNRTQYARIISQIEDASANTEDGLLDLNVMVGGTLTNALRIKGGATGTELTSPGSISGSAFVGKQTAASITGANNIDLSTSANHNVTITGNITLTPTNFSGRLGQSGIITLIQDSSGGHSITLNSLFKTPRGDSISFDTTANGISLMSYYVIDASNVAVNYLGPFS